MSIANVQNDILRVLGDGKIKSSKQLLALTYTTHGRLREALEALALEHPILQTSRGYRLALHQKVVDRHVARLRKRAKRLELLATEISRVAEDYRKRRPDFNEQLTIFDTNHGDGDTVNGDSIANKETQPEGDRAESYETQQAEDTTLR